MALSIFTVEVVLRLSYGVDTRASTKMTQHSRIEIDPKILTGKPVIRGTRLSVEFIVGLLAAGWTHADIIDQYPGVVDEDIIACLEYAHDILSAERVFAAE